MQYSKDLANYRLEKAHQTLESAKILLIADQYADAASSSYYCIFHSMRAVLALENVDFKKHSSVISYFRLHYIKTEKFSTKLSEIITELFTVRGESDYKDFFAISKEEVSKQVKNAEYFLEQVKRFVVKNCP